MTDVVATLCPDSFPEERVTELAYDDVGVSDPEGTRHLQECEHCATRYFQHLAIAKATRILAEQRQQGASRRWTHRLRALGGARHRRWVAAAAILVMVSGVAIALQQLLVRFPSADRVRGTAEFVDERQQLVRIEVVDAGRRGQLDVRAVDQAGRQVWSARERWGNTRWAETLGSTSIAFHAVRTLISRSSEATQESVVCVAASKGRLGGLFFIDAADGSLLGSTIIRGQFLGNSGRPDFLEPLPAPAGGLRDVVVAAHLGTGPTARPALVVAGVDGSIRQIVQLPVIDPTSTEPGERHTQYVQVDWRADPPLVIAFTSEFVPVHVRYVSDRLDLDTAEVQTTGNGVSDPVVAEQMQARITERALDVVLDGWSSK